MHLLAHLALQTLRPTATKRGLELAIAAQAKTVSVYRTMERNADARWKPQWAALLHQSETRVAKLQAALQRWEAQV